jgi:hypothetical protein
MFNLSTMGTIMRPAVCMLKSTPRLKLPSESNVSTMDLFSGMYKIIGFKHVINMREAYSQFTVFKDLAAELQDAEE